MELVTGAMGSLLPKLGKLLKEEYGLQKGVKKKIEKLSRELEVAHAVLRKIGDVPLGQLDELVRLWGRDVREASYDMEDVVDTFLVRVVDATEPTDEAGKLRRLRKKVGRLFKKSKARRNISTLIDDISQKLEEVAERRGRYTLDTNVVSKPVSAETIDPRIVNLYKRATELVAIEEPRDELINMLSLGDDDIDVSDNMKTKIVSVVGFGGLGKTTLAKAVYDRLKPCFKYGAFVPVGQNPDMKKVLRDILIGLDEEKNIYSRLNGLDEKQLIDKINEFVKRKRCFIVIDDIWDKESWKLIRCALQESNRGCRLVMTTRISEVATYAGEAYKIQPLSHDNSKKLLYARIADGEGKYFGSPSAEACERILKKCGGVPLAIITIASLLASKPGEDWSEVYNSIGFGHKGNDDVDNTRKILSFSYYDLPSHLKTCLLYLSIFPEDHEIEKNSLIWHWIAEGFIDEEQTAAGVELFDLGERYYNELINRSMIQPKERGDVDECFVHDMVLDLIRSLSSTENFVTILDGGEQQKLPRSIARRLALHGVEQHNGQLTNVALEKVRTLFAYDYFGTICPRFAFLRVVDMVMVRYPLSNKGVMGHLRSLPHLRYLRLLDYTNIITELPREVRYLKFLQTLDLRTCFSIKELPEDVGLLTQLMCLRVGGTKVPAGLIGKLTTLQELCISPPASDAMQFVKELGQLRDLRVLSTQIHVTSESLHRVLLESLGNLHNIKELNILGSSLGKDYKTKKGRPSVGGSDAGFFLTAKTDAGLVSCRHIRVLDLHCFRFSELRAWINSSLTPNLGYLCLKLVVLEEQDMEALAGLPELYCLQLFSSDTKLLSIKIPDEDVGYFRRLRFLWIVGPSIFFDLRGSSKCNSNGRVPSNNTIMPSLESLEFDVHVRSLKDKNFQLVFEMLLGFHNLGTSSLQRVTAHVNCEGARIWEVEEVEAALKHAAAVHPKRPTLLKPREQLQDMISCFQEACIEVRRNPDLVNKAWKLANIINSGDIRALRMPDPAASSSKVIRLLYTNNGLALLALSCNAVHKLWKWEHSDKNIRGKSSEFVPPILWQPESGILMRNDTTDGNPEEATACVALYKNDSYIISASGGKVSWFDIMTFKTIRAFMAPPPAATFLAFHPQENDIIAIGREDSSIQIYNVYLDEVMFVLRGHKKKITGLAFSLTRGMLVSSGADAQLFIWNTNILKKNVWEKRRSRYIQPPSNRSGALSGDTMVQFHYNGIHILVVHETRLAIYDGQLECLCSWFPRDALPTPISSAVYSLGCLLVYAGFCDGAIGIFEAESLTLRCRIAPSAYIPSSISSGDGIVYPTVVAAHPWKPNQIAMGMSDGAVHVLEPLDTDGVQVESNASSGQCSPSGINNSGGPIK